MSLLGRGARQRLKDVCEQSTRAVADPFLVLQRACYGNALAALSSECIQRRTVATTTAREAFLCLPTDERAG